MNPNTLKQQEAWTADAIRREMSNRNGKCVILRSKSGSYYNLTRRQAARLDGNYIVTVTPSEIILGGFGQKVI